MKLNFKLLFLASSLVCAGVAMLRDARADDEATPAATEAVQAQPERIRDLDPDLTAPERAVIKAFYRQVTEREPIRRALVEIRRRQIADPLDQLTHEILFKSPEFAAVVNETMAQVRDFIAESYIGHLGSASLAMPGKDGQLQGLLAQMERLKSTGLYLFPADAKLRVFAKGGPVNAYTWSGDHRALDVVWFDGLIDLTASHPESRYAIGGHELAHIFFEHVLQRVALTLIFHATAKNLIPPEPRPGDSDDLGKKDDPKSTEADKRAAEDLRRANQRSLERWKTELARAIVPHVGKIADRDPAFIPKVAGLMDRMADRINQSLGGLGVQALAQDIYAAAMGLPAGKDVVISKDAEKKFRQALTRLSNSQETSCDNFGRIQTELLAKKPQESATRAFMLLMGSRHQTYPAMLKQVRAYLEEIGSVGGRQYREAGEGHPNVVSRAAAMDLFAEQHESLRILTNPFLTLVADYLALTKQLVQLDQSVKSVRPREGIDRQVDAQQLRVIKENAAAMSKIIEDVVVREVLAVQAGKEKDLDSTIVLLYALQRAVGGADGSGTIASANDIRLELGRPGRLGLELLGRLKAEQGKAAADIATPVDVSAPKKEKAPDVISMVVGHLEEVIPPSPLGALARLQEAAKGRHELLALAAACQTKALQ